MANARYTISIPEKDTELIRFIEDKTKQSNLSAYIRDLLRKDMENYNEENLEQIYEYIIKRMREDRLTIIADNPATEKNFISEEDKDTILNLF